jgi:hypothetical protein
VLLPLQVPLAHWLPMVHGWPGDNRQLVPALTQV